ncbi:type II secretion system protein [Patescibacteria group bacterium]
MKNKGFSFIEILVVTTIIAVLTMVGVANFRVANQKAKDGKRKGDLEQIRAALELYRTDENEYPDGDIISADIIQSVGGNVYMSDVPDDPANGYDYYYTSDGMTYSLCAALELDLTGSCTAGGADCGTEACNYQINSPD